MVDKWHNHSKPNYDKKMISILNGAQGAMGHDVSITARLSWDVK